MVALEDPFIQKRRNKMKLVKHKKLLAIRKKRNKKRANIKLQTSHSTSRRSIIRASFKLRQTKGGKLV